MYCKNCGKEINNDAEFCPYCGSSTNANNNIPNMNNQNSNPADTGSAGWAVLGFFIPIVGLILYLVWRDTEPKNAKMAGKGALISAIVYVVLIIILLICSIITAFLLPFLLPILFPNGL